MLVDVQVKAAEFLVHAQTLQETVFENQIYPRGHSLTQRVACRLTFKSIEASSYADAKSKVTTMRGEMSAAVSSHFTKEYSKQSLDSRAANSISEGEWSLVLERAEHPEGDAFVEVGTMILL